MQLSTDIDMIDASLYLVEDQYVLVKDSNEPMDIEPNHPIPERVLIWKVPSPILSRRVIFPTLPRLAPRQTVQAVARKLTGPKITIAWESSPIDAIRFLRHPYIFVTTPNPPTAPVSTAVSSPVEVPNNTVVNINSSVYNFPTSTRMKARGRKRLLSSKGRLIVSSQSACRKGRKIGSVSESSFTIQLQRVYHTRQQKRMSAMRARWVSKCLSGEIDRSFLFEAPTESVVVTDKQHTYSSEVDFAALLAVDTTAISSPDASIPNEELLADAFDHIHNDLQAIESALEGRSDMDSASDDLNRSASSSLDDHSDMIGALKTVDAPTQSSLDDHTDLMNALNAIPIPRLPSYMKPISLSTDSTLEPTEFMSYSITHAIATQANATAYAPRLVPSSVKANINNPPLPSPRDIQEIPKPSMNNADIEAFRKATCQAQEVEPTMFDLEKCRIPVGIKTEGEYGDTRWNDELHQNKIFDHWIEYTMSDEVREKAMDKGTTKEEFIAMGFKVEEWPNGDWGVETGEEDLGFNFAKRPEMSAEDWEEAERASDLRVEKRLTEHCQMLSEREKRRLAEKQTKKKEDKKSKRIKEVRERYRDFAKGGLGEKKAKKSKGSKSQT